MRVLLRRQAYFRCPHFRSYHTHGWPRNVETSLEYMERRLPPIRILGPTLWALAAAGTFYIGFAAYDVYSDVENVKKRRIYDKSTVTWEDIQRGKSTALLRNMWARQAQESPSLDVLQSPAVMAKYWDQLLGPEKLMWGAIGLNSGLYGLRTLSDRVAMTLCHIPAATRNYTLLTSTFGHAGLIHLGLNMFALYQFTQPVASSKTFQGSGSHLGAFYLSSGVLASLAFHLTASWPAKRVRLVPGLGASGAVLALVSAYAMEYPEHRLGIIFIPYISFPARDFLAAFAVLETYGLFVGFKTLPFAHAAHLAGMAIGWAYVSFDGKSKLWDPARKIAFNQMRTLGMI